MDADCAKSTKNPPKIPKTPTYFLVYKNVILLLGEKSLIAQSNQT
jgi:hypothetical protein